MVMLRKSTLLPLVLASVIGLTGAVECPAIDKKGGTLKGTDVDADFAVCEYTIAGRCEYFASNGSFSSGSSNCPVGEPQPGGVATPDNAEQQGGQNSPAQNQNAPVETLQTVPSLPTIVQTQNVPVATLPSPVQPQVATTQAVLPTIPIVNAPASVLSVPPIAIPSVLPTLSLPGVELPSVSIPSIPIPSAVSLPPVQIPSALSLPPVQLPSAIPPVESLPAAVTSLLPSVPQVSPPAVQAPGVPLNDPNVAQVTSFSTVFVKPTGLSDVAPPTSYPSSATAARCGSVLLGAAVSVLVGFMLL